MDARLVHNDEASRRTSAGACKSLARAGINPASEDAASTCPAIVFFETADEALLARLDSLRAVGCERILAVALDARPEQSMVWRLLDAGASDLVHGGDADTVARTLSARLTRWHEVDQLMSSALISGSLIGPSPRWQATLRQIVEVARFTPASALILGESGTGKELVARLVHALDPRPEKGDLVVVDCTTIVPDLSGSEFFGHERGAFTGAAATRDGAFALARGGTLFLDEVGELPLSLQAQLLRAIQEQTYKRVGGNIWFKTDFRLVCATHRDLLAGVQAGTFRHDLYHRIANWVFTLPPLRDRIEDVVPLARHFANQRRGNGGGVEMDAAVMECLLRRPYPGNVRDLRQLIMRIMDRHVGDGMITVGDLPPADRPSQGASAEWTQDEDFQRCIQVALAQGVGMKEIGRAAEESAVRVALREADGNLQRAANRLGVTDRALQLRRANARQGQHAAHQLQQPAAPP